MSLSYRPIRAEKRFCTYIWRKEQALPQWYKDSSAAWTKNKRAFNKFWSGCEIYGLFDGELLIAAVYLEQTRPDALNVHLSVVEKISADKLARFFTSLIKHKKADGINDIRAWALCKNRFLREIIVSAGFKPTSLSMFFGSSRGKLLEWTEYYT